MRYGKPTTLQLKLSNQAVVDGLFNRRNILGTLNDFQTRLAQADDMLIVRVVFFVKSGSVQLCLLNRVFVKASQHLDPKLGGRKR